ncbi:MAG: hypothetical protein AB7V45_01385 [Candidatus Krumholzibacteriia bacterium]
MKCLQCHRTFAAEARIASMSGSIMGDEVTDAYFLCPACDVYTVATWWDDFTGLETESSSGPLSRDVGDARVAIIRGCEHPWDKTCRCPAHRSYFNDALD